MGDKIIGRIKSIGRNAKGIFGLFITIDNFDCLLPYSMIPKSFKEKLETVIIASEIEVSVYSIDYKHKKVVVKLSENDSVLKGVCHKKIKVLIKARNKSH